MKKKILLLAAAVICVASFASGTLAYYTAEEKVHNVITSGAVDILIEEWQQSGNDLLSYPKDTPIAIMPGTAVSKIVTVKNMEEECYVRAGYDIVVKDSEKKVMDISDETLENIVSIVMNEEKWSQKSEDDFWWYYNDSVKTGDASEPFITEVSFDGPNMTNEYQNCTVEVIVVAQAVQTANNRSNALEATGWPAE